MSRRRCGLGRCPLFPIRARPCRACIQALAAVTEERTAQRNPGIPSAQTACRLRNALRLEPMPSERNLDHSLTTSVLDNESHVNALHPSPGS